LFSDIIYSIFQINLRAQNKKDDSVCSSKMSQVAIRRALIILT